MSQPTYGIAITADDKTAKGVSSAERRIGGIPKRVDAANRSSVGKASRAILKTFSETEKAGSKIFGNKSMMVGVASRFGAIGEAAGAMGEGMGAAAAEGGILTGVLGGVGAAVAGTVGALVAAGVAAFNVANGWSKTAATIGRTAEIIGVGTKAMQEFSAAAERMGVDKDKAMGGLGGLSQSLNDARYGRNTAVIGLLDKLGIAVKTGADGDVDVEGMLPAIADAFARQTSSGKRKMAQILGIPLDTIPVFSQGGKALSGDMADTEKTGVILTPDDIALGKRQVRRNTIGSQEVQGKILTPLKRGITGGLDSAETWALNKFGGGAETIDRAGGKMDRAADKMGRAADRISSSGSGGGGGSNSARIQKYFLDRGYSPQAVLGIAAGIHAESRSDPDVRGGYKGRAVGIGQWLGERRKELFRRYGRRPTLDQQLEFMDWELQGGDPGGEAVRTAPTPEKALDAYIRKFMRPAEGPETNGDLRRGRAFLQAPEVAAAPAAPASEIPVKVTVEMKGAPPGTRATVKAGRSANPAVSYALAPVHGG